MQKDQIFWFILQVLYYWIPRKKTKLVRGPRTLWEQWIFVYEESGHECNWTMEMMFKPSPVQSLCVLSCHAEYSAHENQLSALFSQVFAGHLSTHWENGKFLFSPVMFHLSHCSFREAEQTCQIQKMRDRTKRNRALKERKRKGSESRNERN